MSLNLDSIRAAATLAEPVGKKIVPEAWERFETVYREQVEGKPRAVIMLYGMYSHGKSTLVNALLGKNSAEIGKPPTTDELKEYEWSAGHCILRDTPGIQAREAHTQIADASLRESALVAFVVESGAIEEHIVWHTLARMLKERQKVCVIINDFDECRHRPELVEPLRNKLRTHLQEAARKEGFGGDIVAETPILIVNAKQALKGRLDHKERLVEDAGLPKVEQELIRLAASMDINDVLNTLRRSLLQVFSECKLQLANNDKKQLLADAQLQLSAMKNERDVAFDRIMQTLDIKLSALEPQLHAIFERGSSQGARQDELQSIVKTLMAEMTPVIEKEVGSAARQIETICIQYDSVRQQCADDLEHNGGMTDQVMNLVRQMDWTTLSANIDLESAAREIIINVLQQCKEWFPKIFSGIGSKTIARWAGTVVSALGVVASLGAVLWQVYDDYQAQQRAEDEARRRAESIRNAVLTTQEALRQAFRAAIDQIFSEAFDSLISQLSAKVQQLAAEEKSNTTEWQTLVQAETLLA